jgi:hypothetical protein
MFQSGFIIERKVFHSGMGNNIWAAVHRYRKGSVIENPDKQKTTPEKLSANNHDQCLRPPCSAP